MNKKVIVLSVLCALGAQTAAANEVGFYIGGYVGQTSKEVPLTPLQEFQDAINQIAVFEPTEQHSSLDDTDIGFALIGGYRWNRYLAFETSYTKLGTVTYKTRATGEFPFETGTMNTDVVSETSGFTLSVLGTWPVTRDWELYVRGGMLFANNRLRVEINSQGQDFIPPLGNHVADSFSKSSNDTYASVGISRRVLEIYDLRLEYQRVFDQGMEITGAQGDLDAALLGLTVTF
jgi:hypothetical protein